MSDTTKAHKPAVDKFVVDGEKYKYFHHPINTTSVNERAVEIPIILKYVKRHPRSTLEVGNVLSQYFGRHKYTTVDLHEIEDGVINEDIVDYHGGPFQLIVSISTFEHIGVDDCDDRFSAVDAVRHCAQHLLAPGGTLIFTVPVGYNPVLDAWLMYRWPGKNRYLLRISKANHWIQVEREVLRKTEYGKPYKCANGLIVAKYISSGKGVPLAAC